MITLYTTHCPKCNILESKLRSKNISFTIIDDSDEVVAFGRQVGIMAAPIVDNEGKILDFNRAITWLNNIQ